MVILAGITRSVARSVIPKMFSGGFSATAALKRFRGIGGQIRTQRWYADWREITGMKKLERTYRFIPRKHRLSYSMMAKTESLQHNEYKYVFEVHGRDADTGEYTSRMMSFGSETRYSIEDVEAEYAEIMSLEADYYEDQYGFLADDVELFVVTRKR